MTHLTRAVILLASICSTGTPFVAASLALESEFGRIRPKYSPSPLSDTETEKEYAKDLDEGKRPAVWRFDTLLPGWKSLFVRSFDLQAIFLDQPAMIFSGVDPSDPTLPVFLDNPDDTLLKLEAEFKPGRLFRSTSELSSAYELFSTELTKPLLGNVGDPLGNVPDSMKLFKLACTKDYREPRFPNAWAFTIGVSQRPSLIGSVPIPPELRDDEWEASFSVSFDPDALIVFPEEVAAAYDALQKHLALDKRNRVDLRHADSRTCLGLRPNQCLKRVSGITVKPRWWAAALPTIELKRVDEFGLVASSGVIFRLPSEGTVDSLTLTWNLSKSLNSASHRREMIKAVGTHLSILEREARFGQTLELRSPHLRIPYGFPVPVQLRAGYKVEASTGLLPKSLTWTVLKPAKGLRISATGMLESWVAEIGSYSVDVLVADDVGNQERFSIDIEVYQ